VHKCFIKVEHESLAAARLLRLLTDKSLADRILLSPEQQILRTTIVLLLSRSHAMSLSLMLVLSLVLELHLVLLVLLGCQVLRGNTWG
jgi:hypothetical protein